MGSSVEVHGYAWKTVNGALTTTAHVISFITTLGIGTAVAGTPDFEHMAIVVFGYVCEFGSEGVANKRVCNGRPESCCDVNGEGRKKVLGKTSKTLEEFFNWMEQSKKKYNKKTYHVVDCNCIHWAMEAAEFLGVKCDPAWEKLLDWLKAHRVQAWVGASLFNSSNCS